MTDIKYHIIKPDENEKIELIADWYLSEWNIPAQTTIEKTKNLSAANFEFQVLMTVDNKPIATGGLYNHVELLDKEPRLNIYKNWLALVYTKPDLRGKGLGTLICNHIQDYSKDLGLKEIYLFTHTAENLYKRLGWQQLERLTLGGKNIVVMKKNLNDHKPSGQGATPFVQTFFHGTKADLKVGDLIVVGNNSNYGQRKNAKYIFLTATLDAAIWGAELAFGEGRERIYLVEPIGEIEDDPDLTDKKFPGNPTKSYRSTKPFKVVGEVTIWQGHSTEQVKAMKDALEKLKEQGINSLND